MFLITPLKWQNPILSKNPPTRPVWKNIEPGPRTGTQTSHRVRVREEQTWRSSSAGLAETPPSDWERVWRSSPGRSWEILISEWRQGRKPRLQEWAGESSCISSSPSAPPAPAPAGNISSRCFWTKHLAVWWWTGAGCSRRGERRGRHRDSSYHWYRLSGLVSVVRSNNKQQLVTRLTLVSQ